MGLAQRGDAQRVALDGELIRPRQSQQIDNRQAQQGEVERQEQAEQRTGQHQSQRQDSRHYDQHHQRPMWVGLLPAGQQHQRGKQHRDDEQDNLERIHSRGTSTVRINSRS